MSDGEEELRSALLSAILRGMRDCDPARVHEIPDLSGLPETEMWPLMKAATALGYDIVIRTIPGKGRVTIEEG